MELFLVKVVEMIVVKGTLDEKKNKKQLPKRCGITTPLLFLCFQPLMRQARL